MLPFTTASFLEVFAHYNTAIWPAQIVAYGLGVVAVALVVRPIGPAGRIVSAILAAFWFWMGAVYHLGYFAAINPAANLFGAAFILEGLLLAWFGVVRGTLDLRWRTGPLPLAGAVLALYALVVYGLLAVSFGHPWPVTPLFGVAPCPTTIFTFALLLMARRPVPLTVLAVPFLWALVGGSAAFLLGVPEDYGLIIAGVLGTGLLLWQRHTVRHSPA